MIGQIAKKQIIKSKKIKRNALYSQLQSKVSRRNSRSTQANENVYSDRTCNSSKE